LQKGTYFVSKSVNCDDKLISDGHFCDKCHTAYMYSDVGTCTGPPPVLALLAPGLEVGTRPREHRTYYSLQVPPVKII
jgi:hypothetical protein